MTAGDKASPAALIALGLQVQLESQMAVSRMARVVESSKQVGAQTLVAMEAQHEAKALELSEFLTLVAWVEKVEAYQRRLPSNRAVGPDLL